MPEENCSLQECQCPELPPFLERWWENLIIFAVHFKVASQSTKVILLWQKRGQEIVGDLTWNFFSGLAFCALIHRHRPDLLDYSKLSKVNISLDSSIKYFTGFYNKIFSRTIHWRTWIWPLTLQRSILTSQECWTQKVTILVSNLTK